MDWKDLLGLAAPGAGPAEALALAVLAVALAAASASDLARRTVPDACSAAVAASGVARALLACAREGAPGPLVRAALGAAATLAVMLAAALVSMRARGEPGVGGGDVKLLGAAGTWLGPVRGLAAVALSCALGVAAWALGRAASVPLRARRGRAPGPEGIPLAPAIAAATLVLVLLAPAS